jgi:hypothetical protein
VTPYTFFDSSPSVDHGKKRRRVSSMREMVQ